ncbi:unnamed protein product [Cunninghamella blakesleeana]
MNAKISRSKNALRPSLKFKEYRFITTKTKTNINQDTKNENGLRDKKETNSIILNFRISIWVLFIISFILRIWNFDFTNTIIQSELVIAQQINWSIKGNFFIGELPPASTLLYTLIAKLFGYNGNEIILYPGQSVAHFPLNYLRLVSLFLNSLTIPSSYLAVYSLNHNYITALFTAFLLTFENGMIVQSRYISADALTPLAYSTLMQLFFSYRNGNSSSFKERITIGFLMGVALSIKWQTSLLIISLWAITIFEDYRNLLPKSGDHDLLIDSTIRYLLTGNKFKSTQHSITYGSKVTLKYIGINNGYLHSHSKNYTSGSKQQQVTVYPFEDLNNMWIIKKPGISMTSAVDSIEYLKNNDIIELEHIATSRKLYSHEYKPPIHQDESYHEVAAFNTSSSKENKNKWWIKIITKDEDYNPHSFDPIHTLTTRFRLLHQSGCYLSSHNQPLFKKDGAQQEVTCMRSASPKVSTWIFEFAHNEQVEKNTTTTKYIKPSFIQKLYHIHILMWNYRQVVYDRLSHIKSSDNNDYDTDIKSISWILSSNGRLIWDDIMEKSVYITVNPILRIFTVILVIILPFVYIIKIIHYQYCKRSAPTFFLHSLPPNTMDIVNIMWVCISMHVVGLYMFPKHSTSLSDVLPVMIFSSIGISVITECLAIKIHYHLYTKNKWLYINNNHNNLHFIFVLLVSLLSFNYCLKQSIILDDSSILAKQKYGEVTLGIFNYNKNLFSEGFPELHVPTTLKEQLSDVTASLVADENRINNEIEIKVHLPGRIKLFSYNRGELLNAQNKINQIQSEAFKKASKSAYGVRRFIRAKETPPPVLNRSNENKYFDHY